MLPLTAVLALASAPKAAPLGVRLQTVTVERIVPRANLISNSGFESVGSDGMPTGWTWSRRNTDATCSVDSTVSHSGKHSIRLTNGTAFGAHIYGMLWRTEAVPVEPGKPYTLSGWFRSLDSGVVHLMGGAGWQFRVAAPATGAAWRRAWLTFTPGDGDRDFVVRIGTESETRAIWIDDLKLEQGSEPTPAETEADPTGPAQLTAVGPLQDIQGDGAFTVPFVLVAPAGFSGTVGADLPGGVGALHQSLRTEPGIWRLIVSGDSRAATDRPIAVTVRLRAIDRPVVSDSTALRFHSASAARQRIAALRPRIARIRAALDRLKRSGQDISYPLVSLTVLANFVGYAEQDAASEVRRSIEQIGDLEAIAARLEMSLRTRARFPGVPRRVASVRPTIEHGVFTAPVLMPGSSKPVERPVFLYGYGHFNQVKADLPKFPAYGVNFVQVEFGPNSVFPAEGIVSEAPMREMRATLDRAQRAGLMVCLLVSPHYMPDWAMQKWPQLHKHRDGFIQYCIHAPEGRDLLKRFLKLAIAPLKDHPALHSICLSNEPVNKEEPCEYARQSWHVWLADRHRTIANLNERWHATYADFAAVPLPDPFGDRGTAGAWADFIRFNQEQFADWHRMMADAIHEVAPALPVHAKAMNWTMLNDGDVVYGVDPTLFASFSQINGNDAVNWYSYGQGEYAQGWLQNAMGHDLQRSVLDAPVCNTENHIIPDRDTRYVPAGHVRTALWQAAIHGQGATAIWVWERASDPKSDFYGSIMHRPACAEAVGIVNHDLNRAANEVAAIQRRQPDVYLLHSVSALTWDGGQHVDCMAKTYEALAFLGLKVGFVTERQLEAGTGQRTGPLLVPDVVHLSTRAAEALATGTMRVVPIGSETVLTRDEYDHEVPARFAAGRVSFTYGKTTGRDLVAPLSAALSAELKAAPVTVTDRFGHVPWGVESRWARVGSAVVVDLCNYLQTPATVELTTAGKRLRAVDVLTGERLSGAIRLPPLEPRLARIVPSATWSALHAYRAGSH